MTNNWQHVLSWSTVALALTACTSASMPETTWFKGNTHAHTTICGHADTSPDSVALWYYERGYHFLILSEHNHYIDPATVNLPDPRREDFILVPGEEVTGKRHVHTTAMNIQEYVQEGSLQKVDQDASPEERLRQTIAELRIPATETKTEILQRHTKDIYAAGGVPILNHPNWQSGLQAHEILPAKDLHMFELYNGHPDVQNWGADEHIAVEAKWDSLLTAGMLILGVSSDDAHHFQEYTDRTSNPGRGWVMVDSDGQLTPDAITGAMARGRFYASNGVMLSSVASDPDTYKVRVDTAATRRETASRYVVGKRDHATTAGYLIEFIGDGGQRLASTTTEEGRYKIKDMAQYVRAKITYTRQRDDGTYESFFAWTQPQFLDERADLLAEDLVLHGPHHHAHPHGDHEH